jgi:hypothetical protein
MLFEVILPESVAYFCEKPQLNLNKTIKKTNNFNSTKLIFRQS